MKNLYWKRVLLKLSGEALMGDKDFGISPDMLNSVSNEIKDVVNLGTELCLVIGGGNIYRGITGVSKGLGYIVAQNCIKKGWKVFGVSRSKNENFKATYS